MPQAPHTEELDEHMKECIQALHGAVNWAMPHLEDSKVTDKAIQDCKEILDVVLEGKISEWLE